MRRLRLALALLAGLAAPAAAQLSDAVPANKQGLNTQAFPYLFNGSTWDRMRAAPGALGVPGVSTEGTKATYSQCSGLLTLTTGSGDIAILQGSASKTVRVTRVEWSAELTSAASGTVELIRRSAAASGGTSATPDTVAKADSADPAPSAVLTAYTAVPTPGASAGVVRRVDARIVAGGAFATPLAWDFGQRNEQALVLRGAAEFLSLFVGSSAAGSGNGHQVCFTWTEE